MPNNADPRLELEQLTSAIESLVEFADVADQPLIAALLQTALEASEAALALMV